MYSSKTLQDDPSMWEEDGVEYDREPLIDMFDLDGYEAPTPKDEIRPVKPVKVRNNWDLSVGIDQHSLNSMFVTQISRWQQEQYNARLDRLTKEERHTKRLFKLSGKTEDDFHETMSSQSNSYAFRSALGFGDFRPDTPELSPDIYMQRVETIPLELNTVALPCYDDPELDKQIWDSIRVDINEVLSSETVDAEDVPDLPTKSCIQAYFVHPFPTVTYICGIVDRSPKPREIRFSLPVRSPLLREKIDLMFLRRALQYFSLVIPNRSVNVNSSYENPLWNSHCSDFSPTQQIRNRVAPCNGTSQVSRV